MTHQSKLGLVLYAPVYDSETFALKVLDPIRCLLKEPTIGKIVVVVINVPEEQFHGVLMSDGPPEHIVSNTSRELEVSVRNEFGERGGNVTVLNLQIPHPAWYAPETPYDQYALCYARMPSVPNHLYVVPKEVGIPTPDQIRENTDRWTVADTRAA